MYIRHTSLRRQRAAILSALFGGISALCLPLAVSAQDTDYAVDAPKSSSLSQEAPTRMSSFSHLEDTLRLHPSLDALNLSAEANRQRAEGALGLPPSSSRRRAWTAGSCCLFAAE